MICPNCAKELVFSRAQQEKIDTALARLGPGKTLKIGCPHCRQPFFLGPDGQVQGSSANGAAPPLTAAPDKPARPVIEPPPPPDLSWLASGDIDREEVIEDVPQVLILVRDDGLRAQVEEAFAELGYQPLVVASADEAVERMRFATIAAVVYHTGFEDGPLAEASFHRHMCRMGMSHRRTIYYVLIGPDFHTLYDLQALALSANLVVNDRDVANLPLIIRKGLADYEDLFGPYLAALQEYGKR